MNMIWIWAIIIVVALIAEFLTMQMVSIWLAVGGLVGLILAIIGGIGIEVQIIVAIAVAFVSILALRKVTLKFLTNKTEGDKAEVLVGKTGKVINAIDKETSGTVKINGVIWTAIADKNIAEGTEIKIIDVVGNRLKVKEVKE
ncbi:MAG: NfeD family protein [Clostridia bacterium]|nr:NfeD family protein [Clostridia bacterium]